MSFPEPVENEMSVSVVLIFSFLMMFFKGNLYVYP